MKHFYQRSSFKFQVHLFVTLMHDTVFILYTCYVQIIQQDDRTKSL